MRDHDPNHDRRRRGTRIALTVLAGLALVAVATAAPVAAHFGTTSDCPTADVHVNPYHGHVCVEVGGATSHTWIMIHPALAP